MIDSLVDKTQDVVLQQIRDYNTTKNLLQTEITGIYGQELLQDMQQIITYYGVYERGSGFTPESNKDFIGANLRYKHIKNLIDKEARFLFSVKPDIVIRPKETEDAADKENTSTMQTFVNEILEENNFFSKLPKAARDCFIAKRVALVANFNEEGIIVTFIPSLEFVFETDPSNVDKLTKFVQFYNTVTSGTKSEQRIYKKKYWMAEDGFCHYSEKIYNGNGVEVEDEIIEDDVTTKFKYIPAWVITNDGLSGDPFGDSEIDSLSNYEGWYSKLANKDMDSIRKGADQIKYTIDMSPESTEKLSVNAGAFWDLSTDPVTNEGTQGQVGVLDNDMSYSQALDTTLRRLKATMHEALDVPEVSSDALQGIVSSGKTLKAIYWGLIVRCNEKMLAWRPAIQNMVKCLIEGAELYPEIRSLYTRDNLEALNGFIVLVDNNYPLPEDEAEAKAADTLEVAGGVMSRKHYMKKWYGFTDAEADEELKQIALEKSLLSEDNYPAFGDLKEEEEE